MLLKSVHTLFFFLGFGRRIRCFFVGRITFEKPTTTPLSILRISHRATGLEHNHFTGFVLVLFLTSSLGSKKALKSFWKKRFLGMCTTWTVINFGVVFWGQQIGVGSENSFKKNWFVGNWSYLPWFSWLISFHCSKKLFFPPSA